MDFRKSIDEFYKEQEIRDSKFPYKQLNRIFPNGIFHLDPAYAITHPWVIIVDSAREVKWAWQRVFMGYDERIVWGLDTYLAERIPKWIREIKNAKLGIPMSIFHEDDFEDGWRIKEEIEEIRIQEYHQYLDKIILGFEAYIKMQDSYDPEQIKQYQPIFDEGFELFHKYFGTLWD